MNLYVSIAFTLLAAVAGMYLLAKTKAEGLGKLFSFVSYLVIIIAGLSLICQIGRGACHMACRTGICPMSENCMPGMMHKEMIIRHGDGMHSDCREMEGCCESRGCCEGMGSCEKDHGCMNMKDDGGCCKDKSKSGCMKDGDEEHGMKKGCPMDMKKDSAKAK